MYVCEAKPGDIEISVRESACFPMLCCVRRVIEFKWSCSSYFDGPMFNIMSKSKIIFYSFISQDKNIYHIKQVNLVLFLRDNFKYTTIQYIVVYSIHIHI